MDVWKQQDLRLTRALYGRILEEDPDWACEGRDARDAAHGLIQYPAMMVPAMQRDVLSVVFEAAPHSRVVMDPFVGSGTALTETLATGRSFIGLDINPLAVLVARVKARPFDAEKYAAAADRVLGYLERDQKVTYSVHFDNQAKWFQRSNSIGLSRIRRSVEKLDDVHCRRFMWVALAETIRRCSNSRTSTYKLHVRTDEQIARIDGIAVELFKIVLRNNVKLMQAEYEKLKAKKLITQKKLGNSAEVLLGNICELGNKLAERTGVDLVLTSPPYGDNTTTVPYGQFSYLALRWIPHEDIDAKVDPELLDTTHTLDTASVGGSKRIGEGVAEELAAKSPAFKRMYSKLKKIDATATGKWTAYCRDLAKGLESIMKPMNAGGYMVWTIGQRRLRSLSTPLVDVLNEFHEHLGATTITVAERRIPVKRMPTHNNMSELMQKEFVCFYRAAA